MNTLIVLPIAAIVYAISIYWLFKQLKFKQHWYGPSLDNNNPINSPLTRFVKRVLDFFLIFFILIALVIPLVAVIMAISQNNVPTWGIDLGMFSGFAINLNEISGIEALGVRNPEFSGKGTINIDTSNLFAWYLFIVISEITALVAIYVSVQFRNMIFTLLSNTAFNDENPQRIKKVGIVIIVWNVLNPLLQYFGWGAVVNQISFTNTGLKLYPAFELNIIALLIGLMMILLSGLLNEATKIKQDQELTI